MALLPGTQLGPYEIVAPLGAGGMGEVYRARDLKLNREVALKILPEGLAADPDRMMRFRREAQVLASLHHSNIAAIFGIEDASGSPALAMELVEGETLAERIALGPIPIEEILPIARQVADALEFAHEKGVTHRDLKPANIKIAPDGTAKLLDFGLAKVLDPAVSSSSDPSSSPTFTNAHTQPGMILGTAAYMSPEQAKGKPVDRRTDVWAFGCVLFEMLTRRRAFDGETVTDALAAIIRAEPDWSLLPASTPPGVRQLLHRCLQKDARQRLQAMGEARIVLEEAISAPTGATPNVLAHPGPPSSQASSRSFTLIWALSALAMLATVAALAGWWRVTHPETEPVRRFDVTLAPGEAFNFEGQSPIAISPDGKRIAYALRRGASAQLYVRTLEQLKATALAGTEGTLGPFFSPDGAWIGFIARNHLLKVPSIGGPVVDLGTVNGNNRGASWAPDGSIYIALSATAGLDRVPAAGGRTQPFTTLDPAKKERTHRWPQVLPDGKNVLFTVGSADSPEYYDDAEIDAASTTTGQRTVLLKGASRGFYVPSGHLIYARGGELFAVPFDATRLRVTGTPVSIVQNVAGDTSSGSSFFDVSHSDLIYVSGPSINERDTLAWVDRSGTVRNAPAPPHHYRDLALSPDGQRAAFAIAEHTQDIWVYDFRANTLNRRTFEGQDLAPVWTPGWQAPHLPKQPRCRAPPVTLGSGGWQLLFGTVVRSRQRSRISHLRFARWQAPHF